MKHSSSCILVIGASWCFVRENQANQRNDDRQLWKSNKLSSVIIWSTLHLLVKLAQQMAPSGGARHIAKRSAANGRLCCSTILGACLSHCQEEHNQQQNQNKPNDVHKFWLQDVEFSYRENNTLFILFIQSFLRMRSFWRFSWCNIFNIFSLQNPFVCCYLSLILFLAKYQQFRRTRVDFSRLRTTVWKGKDLKRFMIVSF